MSLELGAIVEGVVTGITNFGAFVNLADSKVGLIHISEVSDVYVKDIRDFLKEGDKVKVKILAIDDRGKIGLSIKQAQPPKTSVEKQQQSAPPPRMQQKFQQRPAAKQSTPVATFEDKISRFLKDSDDRLTDLKRNTESKRGGRGAGRKG